jgi:serine protease
MQRSRRIPSGWGAALALAAALAACLAAPAARAGPPTGRYLVVLEHRQAARSSATISALLARTGARRSGRTIPELGIVAVRGPVAAIRALRRDPAVASVSPEYLRELRRIPNDPALSTPEDESFGLPPGTPIQWALAREGFPAAWDVTTGTGARVGVVDSGIDGAHPELSAKIASADSTDGSDPRTDTDGHGTHVGGLACAATDNGLGVAGAGWGCALNVVKVSPVPVSGAFVNDLDLIAGVRIAVDRGAQAVNMSFGGGAPTPAWDEVIQYAVSRGTVLVAAASNCNTSDQGAPASQLQQNNASDIDAGRGLVVTAAEFDDQRARTAGSDPVCGGADGAVGFGSQISLAAYGFVAPDYGPLGLISTYTDSLTDRDFPDCEPVVLPSCVRRDLNGDDRYAYLEGTSMATPQVTALAALVADLNPWLSFRDKLRLLKRNARRADGWSDQLGWGIIDGGQTVDAARRVDRLPPSSRARGKRRVRRPRGALRAAYRLRWSGRDAGGRPVLIPSGVRSYDVYMRRGRGHARRIRRGTHRHSAHLRLKPGLYRFYTRATDKAGNREAAPRKSDVRLVVRRARR